MNKATRIAVKSMLLASITGTALAAPRTVIPLNEGWKSKVVAEGVQVGDKVNDPSGVEGCGFNDAGWATVNIPHNWEDYHTKLGIEDNSYFGTAWYRNTFQLDAAHEGKRVFCEFEGAGDYTKVYVNGSPVGEYAGALTSFGFDITEAVQLGAENCIAVRVHHPNSIDDLPWVPGDTYGEPKHEGSQPFGLHRPARILITDPVRIEPFGTHVWCPEVSRRSATVRVRTEVGNYGSPSRTVTLKSEIMNAEGSVLKTVEDALPIAGGVVDTFDQTVDPLADPRLWDGTADPYLHKVRSSVMVGGEVVDQTTTTFGIYWIEWPKSPGSTINHFKLNGRQVFLNGTCEYQHLLGADHAFSEEQVKARVEMIRAAGFNAMRDAHYPHTLSYYDYMDRAGIVNWPQMSSRTNSRTDAFVDNYKRLTARWVKERRNHPCIVLWGVQNESDLTRTIHRQLVGTIQKMDPLAKQQRLAVVCHSTVPGTDWEIPQDWSGVYGGNFNQYDPVLDNESGTMVGEYGSWIVLGSHVDKTYNGSEGDKTETYACALYEAKIRRGEMLRDDFCGHFQWIFSTHSNPGRPIATDRRQKEGWDGQILAPVNNKGLFTCWGQPYDAYYVFRSNYAPKNADPMVYIVSHTWPDRWDAAGRKSRIVVYSNCDQVTLYNDYKASSLGSKTREGMGTHFQWDDVNIEYNVLYAEGTVGGNVVATDIVVFDNLPEAPNLDAFDPDPPNIPAVESGSVLHRLNCGGGEYTDGNGNTWKADKKFASGKDYGHRSWGDVFNYQHAGGHSKTFDPIRGTADDELFRTFRYGRHHLTYRFQVPAAATYGVEFYCVEPWYGAGDGEGGRGCGGWRMFDIAVEGKTVVDDLDVWKLAGHDRALRIPINAAVNDGVLDITFPEVKAGQAVVSALAVMNGPLSSRPGPARAWKGVRPEIAVNRGVLAVALDTRGSHTVEVLDVAGRMVARRAGRGERRYEFREPMMRSALYFVRVSAGDRVFTTRRITIR